jgi:hypothetical protein
MITNDVNILEEFYICVVPKWRELKLLLTHAFKETFCVALKMDCVYFLCACYLLPNNFCS